MCKLSGTFRNLDCPFWRKGLNGDSDAGKTENKKRFADTFIVWSISLHTPQTQKTQKKRKKREKGNKTDDVY